MMPPRPPPGPSAIVLAFDGPIRRTCIAMLCDRVRAALEICRPTLVICDAGRIAAPDVATIEAFARLQLVAHRGGCGFVLRDPCVEIHELLDLMGLAGVLRAERPLSLEAWGQAEQREQPRGVQEERDP
jgi:hypothetical protein